MNLVEWERIHQEHRKSLPKYWRDALKAGDLTLEELYARFDRNMDQCRNGIETAWKVV